METAEVMPRLFQGVNWVIEGIDQNKKTAEKNSYFKTPKLPKKERGGTS